MMRIVAGLLAAFLALPAWAQSMQQSGTIVSGHVVRWVAPGVAADGGTPTNPGLNTIGVRSLNQCSVGINNRLVSDADGYNQLCLGVTAAGAFIGLTNNGGATDIPLTVQVDGVSAIIIAADGGTVTIPSLAVTGSTCPANGTYLPGTNKLGFCTASTAAGVIDASQNLTIGATTQILTGQTATATSSLQGLSASTSRLSFSGFYFGADTAGGIVQIGKSRGASIGTNTIVVSGDTLGTVNFTGANGTGFSSAAQIRGESDGTPGATNDMPGRLSFLTSADGSATPTEHLRISQAGLITLPTITTDATLTTRTICQNTSTGGLHFGSGAAGICLGTSSARFKDVRGGVRAGLSDVLGWETVAYRYNEASGMPSDHDLLGFTAEQVFTVTPEIVGLGKDGEINTIDMMGMIPILAKAIQELNAKIVAK